MIDWFGMEITFSDESEDEVTARVTVNLAAMRRWAVQYSSHTRIQSPESLVKEVTQDLRSAEKTMR